MEKVIAYCGLHCLECPALIATKNNDDAKRKETAEIWSKEFKHDFKPEDINCEGCMAESDNLFSFCNICEVRECGQEKAVENCAY